MDIRKIRKLIELINETGVGEIEVKSGEESVRINRQGSQVAIAPPAPIVQSAPIMPNSPSDTTETAAPTAKSSNANEHQIKSPMVGTIYLSSAPGEKPFVDVGQQVSAGDTLCLIEAMKMFNKIEADKSGVISARLVENEQPDEYDQALFIIDSNE